MKGELVPAGRIDQFLAQGSESEFLPAEFEKRHPVAKKNSIDISSLPCISSIFLNSSNVKYLQRGHMTLSSPFGHYILSIGGLGFKLAVTAWFVYLGFLCITLNLCILFQSGWLKCWSAFSKKVSLNSSRVLSSLSPRKYMNLFNNKMWV